MDKFLDKLYDKFFLRDVLTIYSVGFSILLSFYIIFYESINSDLLKNINDLLQNNNYKYFIYFFIISVSYLSGLIINILRDIITHSIYYHSINFLHEYYRMRMKFNKISKDYDNIKSSNERFTVIFQTFGNYGFALLIISIFLFIQNYNILGFTLLFFCIICFLLSYYMFRQHKIYNEIVIESFN